MLGQHCCKNWSSTQAIIALSSGEAEFYGVVKASSIGLGCQAVLRDMGVSVQLRVHTDAEAARGIASRVGLGKTRHVAVHLLWVQERVRSGDITLLRVRGDSNVADLLTKHLDSAKMNKFLELLGAKFSEGRSGVTPMVEQ